MERLGLETQGAREAQLGGPRFASLMVALFQPLRDSLPITSKFSGYMESVRELDGSFSACLPHSLLMPTTIFRMKIFVHLGGSLQDPSG